LEYRLKDNSLVYLPDNDLASIVLKSDQFEINDSNILEKNWNSGLTLQAKWISQIIHPESLDDEWLDMVKYSFVAKILTPLTSYLVVENDAQKAMLKKKQEQVLSGNKSLDPGEETQGMSEPNTIIIGILLGLIMLYRYKRRPVVTTNLPNV